MNPGPGEVWLADLGLAAKTRPVVIVSRRDSEKPRALVVLCATDDIPRLPFLNQDSFANVQGISSLPAVRLERRLGRVSDQTMDEIRGALIYALDLHAKLS